jgi:outer membrane autotransporter protein
MPSPSGQAITAATAIFHIGISAGVSESQLDIRGDSTLRGLGITDVGSANIRAWSVGGFALLTTRAWYVGTAAGGSWGKAQTENAVIGAESDFDGSSLTSSLFVGTIVPLPQDLRIDVRGTLGYHRTQGDAHHDTLGIAYGEHVLEHLSGTLSARLFTVIPAGAHTLRPYVQAGVTHRFYYANDVNIQGVDFSFDDADTSLFAAGGIDLEINDWLQLSAGVRQDHSPDYDYVSGRFGVLLKLY